MKRKVLRTIIIIVAMVAICIIGREYAAWKNRPVVSIRADEMTELSLELVYRGKKPNGVSSVQSMAITDDYFVIAGRPFGTKEQGGETNNKLIIIDRDELCDVTDKVVGRRSTFELGHANGMTYNAEKDELVIVGIRNIVGECVYAATINAENFQEYDLKEMPCFGNGIAYNSDTNEYVMRDGNVIRILDADLNLVLDEEMVALNLTNQDIAYHDGYAYLVNWAYRRNDARAVGIRTNQNVIYRIDLNDNYAMNAYVVKQPRLEMESMDFIGDEAFVLFNGGGSSYGYFYIYKISDWE